MFEFENCHSLNAPQLSSKSPNDLNFVCKWNEQNGLLQDSENKFI